MNEKIKQLAKQAGFDYEQMEWNHANGTPSIAETFAELIVRECVKIADNHYDTKSAIHDIKEHFGIE